MNKIFRVMTCVTMAAGLCGCGRNPDLNALKAELDQVQQTQMMLVTNQVRLWEEVELLRTNSLPNLGDYMNFVAHNYSTNELDYIREKATENRQAVMAVNDMLLTKLQGVEDGQSFDRKAESNFDLNLVESIHDIDTNTIEADFNLKQIKIRLGLPPD